MLWLFADTSPIWGLSAIERAGIIGLLLAQLALWGGVVKLLWNRNEKRDEQHRKELERLQSENNALSKENALLHKSYGEAMIARERSFSAQIATENRETMQDVLEVMELIQVNLSSKPITRKRRTADDKQQVEPPAGDQ
jgi:cell division protein FtsB